MKNKLEMAHDYLIKLIEVAPDESTKGELVSVAWDYAELMQYEAKKRNEEEVMEKEGLSFEDAERFIRSYKLVEFYGGLEKDKKKLSTEQSEPYYNYSQQLVDSLKQAIEDVESCL